MNEQKLISLHKKMSTLINEVIPKVSANSIVKNHVKRENDLLIIKDLYGVIKKYNLKNFDKVLILGAGKVSHIFAIEVEKLFYDKRISGLVVTKEKSSISSDKIRIVEAAHPVPDYRSMKYAKELVELLKKENEKTLVLFLVSGGGSSLLSYPVEGMRLIEKIRMTNSLIKSGASINELNLFRKYFSVIKGGGLLDFITSPVITLIISDVIGNDISVISSAPTFRSKPTNIDVKKVLEKYNLMDKLSRNAKKFLLKNIWEKSNSGNSADNYVLFDNKIFQNELAKIAIRKKINVHFVEKMIDGNVSKAAIKLKKNYQKIFLEIQSQHGLHLIISGGETTVKVKGNGFGGRNHELALNMIKHLSKMKSAVFLSLATDGDDGNSCNAGALIDSNTFYKIKKLRLDVQEFLSNNDSYSLLKNIDGLFNFPKGITNVMDIQLLLIEI